ncbi:MAG: hypothetical protein R3192_05495 [Woeseiaceae bacterium]|nr:hypothetical protein [Woeseiaceae bacterium]
MKFFSTLLVSALLAANVTTFAAEIDEASGLVKNPGWETVRIHCGGCHSHALVTSQRADRQTWLDIIRWMQATQNLWQFDPDTETQILDYLAVNYPPQEKRRRAPIPPSLLPQTLDLTQ